MINSIKFIYPVIENDCNDYLDIILAIPDYTIR
jgi:hypothetical protein